MINIYNDSNIRLCNSSELDENKRDLSETVKEEYLKLDKSNHEIIKQAAHLSTEAEEDGISPEEFVFNMMYFPWYQEIMSSDGLNGYEDW
jgi:hypothetical protein